MALLSISIEAHRGFRSLERKKDFFSLEHNQPLVLQEHFYFDLSFTNFLKSITTKNQKLLLCLTSETSAVMADVSVAVHVRSICVLLN